MHEEQELNNKIHAALCANHMTSAVADFLTDLAARIRKLEAIPTPPKPEQPE